MTSRLLFRALLAIWSLGGLQAHFLQAQTPPASTDGSHFEIPATDDGLPGQGPIRRADWFRRLWKDRRSEWARKVESDQHSVVVLGDSITQGWGDDFSAWFPGLHVANRGISGDTSRGVLVRLEEDVLVLHPKVIILLIGTNDLEEKAEPQPRPLVPRP